MIITSEMVISGFISKVVNEIVDVPLNPIKNAIKNADKKKRDKNQSIETRIYQVTIDSLNKYTNDKYKGEETLYDAAESIIKGFKGNKNSNSEAVRAGLKMLVSQVTSDICEDFLGVLCYEICKEENRDLAIEVIILQQKQTNGYIQEEFRRSYLNYEEINKKLDYLIKELIDKKINEERYISEAPIINRADEYAERWNENVFLNNFNEEDENAGTEIKLSDIYKEKCLPHYIWKTNIKSSDKLSNLLAKYVIDRNGRKMLLILGQPGIGKSTLITWMLANLIEKKEDIYVYQFAIDLKNVNWESDNILYEIFEVLNLRYDELENKTLILDGFDEIYVNGNRERILNKINQELKQMNFLQNFLFFMTCRENYVDRTQLEVNDYITLQAWNEQQIKYFCEIYGKEIIKKKSGIENKLISEIKINKILEKKEIFGIPLILYMILALNIAIEKHSSIVDVYDQIFSLKSGGIYDRYYEVEHRINSPEIKRHIHQIIQKIAFWIFENNANKASIPQEKFAEICDNEMKEFGKTGKDIQSDVLIGNYFVSIKSREGEGTDELKFVHRSIYEYFVAVFLFESIYKLKAKEDVAGKLGELLKDGQLSDQILNFLKYKFDSMRGCNPHDLIKEIFQTMLRDGMTYHTKERYRNVIERERNIFLNMLQIMSLWKRGLGRFDDRITIYLQCNIEEGLNLEGIELGVKSSDIRSVFETYLNGADLNGTYLRGANLKKADLVGTYLRGADLRGADLSRADLSRAHLSRADLREANMSEAVLDIADLREANMREVNLKEASLVGAYLIETDLQEANLSGADLRKALLDGANLSGANLAKTIFDMDQVKQLHNKYDLDWCYVFFPKTEEIMSYEEYCIRK